MIELTIKGIDGFDQTTQTFIPAPKDRTIRLEHSLISLSKWEEQTKRRFLSKVSGPQTKEDWILYMQCMSLDGPIDPLLLNCMTQEQFTKVINYIKDNRTATTVNKIEKPGKKNKELSSELLYYYMSALQLPYFAEKWHLSRLLTLIDVANDQQSGGKKTNYKDTLKHYSQLNERNKRRFHTKG